MKAAQVIVIGGGLAGLTAANHLSQQGIQVLLFEKEGLPHHKVCGEYLSSEVLPYLKKLSIPVEDLKPSKISRLLFSDLNGKTIESPLPLGGIGVSRYALDHLFYQRALAEGVEILHKQVIRVSFEEGIFRVTTNEKEYRSDFVLGAFGKRSTLDKSLKRPFFSQQAPWLAVKAHYSNPDFPEDLVALHSFPGGYCGLSKTESGSVNLCYLASYNSFKAHKDPEKFRNEILETNPFLKQFFIDSNQVFEQPLAIAQISFARKASVDQHIIYIGDASGLVHPLCGNGMAMAIHSGKIAAELIGGSLGKKQIDREFIEKEYSRLWEMNFRKRIRTGRQLQKVLLNRHLSYFSQQLISHFPFILPRIIKNTHGTPLL